MRTFVPLSVTLMTPWLTVEEEKGGDYQVVHLEHWQVEQTSFQLCVKINKECRRKVGGVVEYVEKKLLKRKEQPAPSSDHQAAHSFFTSDMSSFGQAYLEMSRRCIRSRSSGTPKIAYSTLGILPYVPLGHAKLVSTEGSPTPNAL